MSLCLEAPYGVEMTQMNLEPIADTINLSRCCRTSMTAPFSPEEIASEVLREEILKIAAKHGAYNIRIFGSVARGEADLNSDIDFLVDLEPGRSLFDLGGLLMDLQELLGCRVDVVTEKGLRQRIREKVLKEAISL